MQRSKVFTHATDCAINEIFTHPKMSKMFDIVNSREDINWISQLISSTFEVALIAIESFGQRELARFNALSLPKSSLFIFFSDGRPNEYLDQIKSSYQSYHFKSPYDYDLVTEALVELTASKVQPSNRRSHAPTNKLDQFGQLVGSSSVMRDLYKMIRRISATDSNITISGESGTGKELVANTIHLASARADGPIVAINCAALSPELVESELFGHVKGAFTGAIRNHQGVFEQAKGGTLFLDEIGEMPLTTQVKLLRVLETGTYKPVGSALVKTSNVRIVSATNKCLLTALADGQFREDLYFRLAHFPLLVPPLRDREADILGLAHYFLAYRNAKDGKEKVLSTATEHSLTVYKWPGNVRQLKLVIERGFVLADSTIEPKHLLLEPFMNQTTQDVAGVSIMQLDQIEKLTIEKSLVINDGNKLRASKQLGISVKTLYNKLERYQQAIK